MTTSATFGIVTEAFAMREFAGFEVQSIDVQRSVPTAIGTEAIGIEATGVARPAAAAQGTASQGTTHGVPWRVVSAIDSGPQSMQEAPTSQSGISMLRGLTGRSAASLTSFFAANPTAIPSILESPPAAVSVSAWWGQLDAASRSSLESAAPQLVGNLDGIPLQARGTANLTLLDVSSAVVRERLDSRGRGEKFGAEQQLQMFGEVRRALEAPPGGEQRTLLSFDPEGAGTAAIVIGDLSTAEYVSVLVPGAFVLVSGQIVQWTDSAQDLHDERVKWAERTWAADEQPRIATVAWIGYQTPGPFEVTQLELAGQGRDALARAIQGVQAERVGDEAFLSVIAHSYGSTAAMMALTEYDFEVDALAVVGSPGGPVSTASALHVRNGSVFVGDAAWDPVAGVGFFGVDPGSPGFGARQFGVSGVRADPDSGETLGASMLHDSYLDPGSESLRNLALISLGLGDRITSG